MKIVIDISDRLITKVKDHYVNPYEVDEICEAILDGTPLPKGHWIQTDNYFSWRLNYVECSCCHKYSLEEGDYCPNCGADMRGDENEISN